MARRSLVPGITGVIASVAGLFFSAFSTHDYAEHLDRQLHETHCSYAPGLTDVAGGNNPCKAAMYSPYSALFRERFWGGVPISLFALGVYAFFFAAALYVLVARDTATKRAWQAYGIVALTPLPVSGLMFAISATHLAGFCKLCVGLYVSSVLLAISGVAAIALAGGPKKPPVGSVDDTSATVVDPDIPWGMRKEGDKTTKPKNPADPHPVETGSWLVVPSFLMATATAAIVPAGVYAASVGDYKSYVVSCGKIADVNEKHGAFVKVPTTHPVQPALTFEDPLCPTCRAFHERLVTEGVYDKLDLTVAIFPLDADCNFLVSQSVHPGACVVAKAFLCGDKNGKARQVLEWSYANQDELTAAGKAGNDKIRAKVKERFPDLDSCIDAKETQQRLDNILHFAVDNQLRVMTPQLFLGDKRVCDEDTDLGLTYALNQLAPKVLR